MKQFSFRLDRVRKFRSDQVELEEARLEQLFGQWKEIAALEARATEEFVDSRRTVLNQAAVMGEQLESLESLREYTAQLLRKLDLEKKRVEAGIEAQKARLLEANRRFRLLDGLRDRAVIAWTAARDKEQEELAAELYLAKLARTERSRSLTRAALNRSTASEPRPRGSVCESTYSTSS